MVIATRASTRIPRDGRTMMEKAIQRFQENDDATKGTSSTNLFIILNNLDNDYIQNVASKLDLVIDNIDTNRYV